MTAEDMPERQENDCADNAMCVKWAASEKKKHMFIILVFCFSTANHLNFLFRKRNESLF